MPEPQETAEAETELFADAEFPISGELEEIPVAEADPKALENNEPPHITSCVCDVCLELNLTTKTQIDTCANCGQPFCFHFASNIDAQYCVNCMSDISVTKQIITKDYCHRDATGRATSVYRRRAREIKIEGPSWLFAQRKIVELSDVELDLAIEYHRNILVLMIDEQERRRNARMHRYAGMKVIHTPATTSVTGSSVTKTTVKKTRTVSKNKADEQIAALIASIRGKGKPPLDIAALLKTI